MTPAAGVARTSDDFVVAVEVDDDVERDTEKSHLRKCRQLLRLLVAPGGEVEDEHAVIRQIESPRKLASHAKCQTKIEMSPLSPN